MKIISHRINTLAQLESVPFEFGAEIDIRYHNDDLILTHDPFGHQKNSNLKFEEFLSHYKLQGPLILNLKSEGIEDHCISLMAKFKLTNWFFLDMSMPYFVKYSQFTIQNERLNFSKENLAVRFSEFEPIQYALAFSDKVRWVWVDYFNGFPLTEDSHAILKRNGFKICLVSPELHGSGSEKIHMARTEAANFEIDAVCTKHPNIWLG